MSSHHITLDLGRIKNPNCNAIAESAIRELKTEIIKLIEASNEIDPITFSKAVTQLNSHIIPDLYKLSYHSASEDEWDATEITTTNRPAQQFALEVPGVHPRPDIPILVGPPRIDRELHVPPLVQPEPHIDTTEVPLKPKQVNPNPPIIIPEDLLPESPNKHVPDLSETIPYRDNDNTQDSVDAQQPLEVEYIPPVNLKKVLLDTQVVK